jgi:hypothetical protein
MSILYITVESIATYRGSSIQLSTFTEAVKKKAKDPTYDFIYRTSSRGRPGVHTVISEADAKLVMHLNPMIDRLPLDQLTYVEVTQDGTILPHIHREYYSEFMLKKALTQVGERIRSIQDAKINEQRRAESRAAQQDTVIRFNKAFRHKLDAFTEEFNEWLLQNTEGSPKYIVEDNLHEFFIGIKW